MASSDGKNVPLFYAREGPRMLSDNEISQLSAAECNMACDQIDQNILGLLQNIDENIVRSYATITEAILPSVERYGLASKAIWDSTKFWKAFFEASAGIRLTDPLEVALGALQSDDETETSTNANLTLDSQDDETVTVERTTPIGDESEASSATPARPSWAEDQSPFDRLQRDLATEPRPVTAPRDVRGYKDTLSRLAELGVDSPDPVPPMLETMQFDDSTTRDSASKAAPSPKKRTINPILYQTILNSARKQQAAHRDQSSSPDSPAADPVKPASRRASLARKKVVFPADLPADKDGRWNGIADLSAVSLTSLDSPVRVQQKSASAPTPTSPRYAQDTFASATRATSYTPGRRKAQDRVGLSPTPDATRTSQTPAKEGASRLARDVLASAAQRHASPFKPMHDAGLGHLEDQDDFRNPTRLADESWTSEDEGNQSALPIFDLQEADNSVSFGGQDGVQLPEDTLFGRKGRSLGFGAQGLRAPDTVERRGFQLHGPNGADEMHTLYGGKLLDSQPAIASPLAGKKTQSEY
ncbi:uncharacterized protein L969DRAFT_88389 [Mixia osmundae IAM 14324]|uniref:DASH complex subunit ASK1 n=1 Tax=Mixia osmundae (strain CBS 9802 / IAM 14324 / JCM 22182 / KY 12970) TaxID=764103 RepID=G7E709_MIXOS|nr:uncharacterized protein L969DRAFT_88389 [Mixia osmundae IAM 14324]KEI38999.1 hypothetical protein L969DRAFT_88389 [Mixia osmundae IAM 14324]GAA98619.1 hypothetical protein E5Q_05306 [Mixia osmundae IAM 14324]